jgi:2-polyprenyl-6-methoxyphenol hydroxylase-like FAD-dependent oxidoreductase
MKRLRIVIAGAGTTGLAAAAFLTRAGHEVRLFERFSQPRPLGAGILLQPTGLA